MKRKLIAGTVATVAGVVALATPAFAHVTVNPGSAPKGGETVLTFRVPNEEDSANTTKVQLFFPSDHPILGLDPQPVPGWQDNVVTAPLNPPVTTDDGTITSYVSEIDYTGGSIPPGNFQQFNVLAQTLPSDGDQVVFKAIQTYSDGNVVRWIDPTVPGQPDPEHPAPTMKLTAAVADDSASGAEPAAGTTVSTKNLARKSTVNAALAVGIVGIVVGAIGLLVAVGALRRKTS